MTDATTSSALAPAQWLLDAGTDAIALTQTHALSRAVVREAAERWPGWWDAELFGPPHREADMAVLEALHEGLRRLRLLRRRGRKLHTTARGRELAAQPERLLALLAVDIGAADAFTSTVADAVIGTLTTRAAVTYDVLDAAAVKRVRRERWAGPDGEPPSEREVGWVVGDVLRRGEAYGLVERRPRRGERRFLRSEISLTAAGRLVYGPSVSTPAEVLVFDAELVNARGVTARLAVDIHEPLTALHDAIQEAFGWLDDHLYSFWLDGVFWGDREQEYTSPVVPDEAQATAEVPLAELGLAPGARVAYVFDFGDEWRVLLNLREIRSAGDPCPPRVLERKGTAPPQYPVLDDDARSAGYSGTAQ